jgi:hypothetical protein
MPAPEHIIETVLQRNLNADGTIDPCAATADLAQLYRKSTQWYDSLKAASNDIEHYKKRHAFKPNDPSPTGSIVVLNEGKERVWAFYQDMKPRYARMRIALVQKKMDEHILAADLEIDFWRQKFGL